MARELLLLRHGKSDWSAGCDDFHRPLKQRGKLGARNIGAWLVENDRVPDYVVSSPAERARATAEICCKSMAYVTKDIHWDERLYLADSDELLAVLTECPPIAQRVMLVGHNPGFEELLTRLVREKIVIPEDGKLLPTATVARLEITGEWHELAFDKAKLVSITRGKDHDAMADGSITGHGKN